MQENQSKKQQLLCNIQYLSRLKIYRKSQKKKIIKNSSFVKIIYCAEILVQGIYFLFQCSNFKQQIFLSNSILVDENNYPFLFYSWQKKQQYSWISFDISGKRGDFLVNALNFIQNYTNQILYHETLTEQLAKMTNLKKIMEQLVQFEVYWRKIILDHDKIQPLEILKDLEELTIFKEYSRLLRIQKILLLPNIHKNSQIFQQYISHCKQLFPQINTKSVTSQNLIKISYFLYNFLLLIQQQSKIKNVNILINPNQFLLEQFDQQFIPLIQFEILSTFFGFSRTCKENQNNYLLETVLKSLQQKNLTINVCWIRRSGIAGIIVELKVYHQIDRLNYVYFEDIWQRLKFSCPQSFLQLQNSYVSLCKSIKLEKIPLKLFTIIQKIDEILLEYMGIDKILLYFEMASSQYFNETDLKPFFIPLSQLVSIKERYNHERNVYYHFQRKIHSQLYRNQNQQYYSC